MSVSYPFVHAATDLGLRSGPILGVNCHMAEGGGTVGFLSRPNPDGVSVHYVVEYSGRVVQMLLESHMQTAIRIHNRDGSYAIRQDDEANGYGHAAAVAVLGAWADIHTTGGPNNATIGIEVEGFAGRAPLNGQAGYDPRADPLGGPNDIQTTALAVLMADIRTRHPGVGLTGHRDHNVKNCPGLRFPWAELGGHGPAKEEDMVPAPIDDERVGVTIDVNANVDWYDLDNRTKIGEGIAVPFVKEPSQYGVAAIPGGPGARRAIVVTLRGLRRVVLVTPSATHDPVAPQPDPAAIQRAVDAALDHVAPAAAAVGKAIDEARIR